MVDLNLKHADVVAVIDETPGLPNSKADLDSLEQLPPPLSKAAGESTPHFIKRVLTEGHTTFDAFLTVAAAQIG